MRCFNIGGGCAVFLVALLVPALCLAAGPEIVVTNRCPPRFVVVNRIVAPPPVVTPPVVTLPKAGQECPDGKCPLPQRTTRPALLPFRR